MRFTKWNIIVLLSVAILFISFTKSSEREQVARYYDRQLDNLSSAIAKLQRSAQQKEAKDSMVAHFFKCRTAYKKVEFFIDVFDPLKARRLNGPDLLKIEDDAPSDSLKPHGLQTIEAILYTGNIDWERLAAEIKIFMQNVRQLRNEPDRIYYFKDDKIWEAMRLGIFRIISLGITGFDAPLSSHSLPETRAALVSVYNVVRFYKNEMQDTMYQKGKLLFENADKYLQLHDNFNTFDRLSFIRDHLNKISAWITICSKQLNHINYDQLTPLDQDAPDLFARNTMNLSFFSPNERYKLTPERIALGKRLFYDTRMSGGNTRSCASCHQPERGFTDGIRRPFDIPGNKELPRNTPTLWNAVFQKSQFYDSRAKTLEDQLGEVVHNTDEMNSSLHDQVRSLASNKEYYLLFQEAYPGGEAPLNEFNIANAIANYVRSLVSLNSRFDRYMRKETDSFTASEKNGFNLFMGKAKCGTCHYAPIFNGLVPPLYQETESEILAVPATAGATPILDSDPGKFGFTKVPLHKYAFKTPTVRNIALTAPYMHNGVFNTLEDVLQFYNDGGGAGRGIALNTQTLPADKLHLTKKEIKDIISFLHALTDTSSTSFGYQRINR